MKKKRRRVRTRIKVIGVLLLGYILFFAFTSIYYRDKWYPNTTVNSIDVSNLTYKDVYKRQKLYGEEKCIKST